jgi:hypothetical protein
VTATDPDLPCPHQNFLATVEVNRIVETEDNASPIAYCADIRVECTNCQEKFRWTGVPAGLNYAHPTCSVDETVLRAPLRPASADPDFGMGLPSFAIRLVDPLDE